MTSRRTDLSSALAALGAVAIAISLWLPWYRLRIPDQMLDQAVQVGRQFGLGTLMSSAATMIRQMGPLHVDAWQAFSQTDVVLIIVAVLAGGLALLAYTGRASGVGAIIAVLGAVGALVTGHRLLSPPVGGGVLHPLIGGYVALAGSLVLIVAGIWSNSQATPAPAYTPFTPTPTSSPPGAGGPAAAPWPDEPLPWA